MLLSEYATKRRFFYSTSAFKCLCTTYGNMNPINWVSSVMLYTKNNNDLACSISNTILIIFSSK